MINPFAKEKNKADISQTAMQTIRLMGSQIIELQGTIDEQSKMIKTLAREIKSLQNLQKDLLDDYEMMRIDQKDLANQVKSVKVKIGDYHGNIPLAEPKKIDEPSLDDIMNQAYPNYKNSEVLKEVEEQAKEKVVEKIPKQEDLKYVRKVETPQTMSNKVSQKELDSSAKEVTNFVFKRLPKILSFDD